MSLFEFIIGMISIILALAIAQLFGSCLDKCSTTNCRDNGILNDEAGNMKW